MSRLQSARGNNISLMDKKLNLLTEKVDKLLNFQEDVKGELQKVNQSMDDIEKGVNKLIVPQAPADKTGTAKRGLKSEDSVHQTHIRSVRSEMLMLLKATQQDASKHRERLEKIENKVDTVDKVIALMGETLKNSKVVDFILKGIVPGRKGV
ncbi:PREDICTED: myosin light chain kinase 3-like [Gavialis gangeticus]|uniref:myosin light chain kinase 3-like n=1 Tax=Gavialis gangeticus TaxID=94835 RepID=UPI00092E557F|nr:PREDICTED: myosin light chain kinase 3-like [Gavialis gangeticus]